MFIDAFPFLFVELLPKFSFTLSQYVILLELIYNPYITIHLLIELKIIPENQRKSRSFQCVLLKNDACLSNINVAGEHQGIKQRNEYIMIIWYVLWVWPPEQLIFEALSCLCEKANRLYKYINWACCFDIRKLNCTEFYVSDIVYIWIFSLLPLYIILTI